MKFKNILILLFLIFIIYKIYNNNNKYFINTLIKNTIREKAKKIWNKHKDINKVIKFARTKYSSYITKDKINEFLDVYNTKINSGLDNEKSFYEALEIFIEKY